MLGSRLKLGIGILKFKKGVSESLPSKIKHRVERRLRGAGFVAEKKGKERWLWVGYSHPVTYSRKWFEKEVEFGVREGRVWFEGESLSLLHQVQMEVVQIRKIGRYENSRGIEVVGREVKGKKSKVERREESKGRKVNVLGRLKKGLRDSE